MRILEENSKNEVSSFWCKMRVATLRFARGLKCLRSKGYTTNEFKIPTANTSRNQIPTPENTVVLF